MGITFPAAYRAWASWVSDVGYGCLQVAQIKAHAPTFAFSLDGDDGTTARMLCEVYSRAVMETCMAREYDNVDSMADVAVSMLIEELFGRSVASFVFDACVVRTRGYVLRSMAQTQAIAARSSVVDHSDVAALPTGDEE